MCSADEKRNKSVSLSVSETPRKEIHPAIDSQKWTPLLFVVTTTLMYDIDIAIFQERTYYLLTVCKYCDLVAIK